MVISPYILKLLALSCGVRSDETIKTLKVPFTMILPHGIEILLTSFSEDDVLINLKKRHDDLYIEYMNQTYPVRLKENIIKDALNDFLLLSGSCLFIFPEGNHQSLFFQSRKFIHRKKEKRKLKIDTLIEDITHIFKKSDIETCFFVNILNDGEDGGIYDIHPYLRLVSKNFKVLTGALVNPPLKKEWIEWSYAIGADIIWYELNCFNKNSYLEKFGDEEKYKLTIDSLLYATTLFPKGCVFTTLIAGAEPVEETLKGIDYLLSNGVIPLLIASPEYHFPLKFLLELYEHLIKLIKKHKLNVSRTGRMAHLLTPAEILKLSSGKSGKKSLYEIISKKLVHSTMRNIYRIRRNLLVREVE